MFDSYTPWCKQVVDVDDVEALCGSNTFQAGTHGYITNFYQYFHEQET